MDGLIAPQNMHKRLAGDGSQRTHLYIRARVDVRSLEALKVNK